jgi:hypothetical protein
MALCMHKKSFDTNVSGPVVTTITGSFSGRVVAASGVYALCYVARHLPLARGVNKEYRF